MGWWRRDKVGDVARRRDDDLDLEALTGIGFLLVLAQLDRIEHKLNRLTKLVREGDAEMAIDIEGLTAAVQENTSATSSVIAVVDRLADELEAAADDPEQVRVLVEELRSNNSKIAEAVTANTPADEGGGAGDGG